MTFLLVAHGIIIRTMCKGHMPVSYIIKKVDLVLVQHQAGCDRVDGRVAPSLVEEAAVFVELVEEVEVGLRS